MRLARAITALVGLMAVTTVALAAGFDMAMASDWPWVSILLILFPVVGIAVFRLRPPR